MMQQRRRKRLGAGGERTSYCNENNINKIIFIDAGNDLDIYQYLNFAGLSKHMILH
jgi:hypothetical protein